MTTCIRTALAALFCFIVALPTQAQPCVPATHAEPIGRGTISYNSFGRGPPVLLVHGLFADKEQWTALACLIADAGYEAIAVDLPGYGKSAGYSLGDYPLEREVENLHALAARLGIARFDIAGNSMGGAIAALYATAYPEQVRSLAFLGSPEGITGWGDGIRGAILSGINPFIPLTPAELDIELHLLFVSPPNISPSAAKSIVDEYVRNRDHYIQVWNIVNLYDDVLIRTPLARKPTLIVWGADDSIFNASGATALQAKTFGGQVYLMPKAGHLLHTENAAAVAPLFIRFLKTAEDGK